LPVELTLAEQARLVAALREALGPGVRVIETHISYVLLTGAHAY
jgi:aminoglycoside phosphotransferase family enzyme